MFSLPKDEHNITYVTFLIHGIGFLLPWNMFINAYDYFLNHKFNPQYMSESFEAANYFVEIMTLVSQIPNVVFEWANIFIQTKGKGSLQNRIMAATGVMSLLFVITVILAMIDTSKWSLTFFIITMIKVFVLNALTAIYQNSVFGIAAAFPPRFIGAIVLGNNICGTFISIVEILTKLGSKNIKLATIYYFLVAIIGLVICMDLTYLMPINRYYRFMTQRQQKIERDAETYGEKEDAIEETPFHYILRKGWPYFMNCFLTLFLTLTIFPSVSQGVKTVNKSSFLGTYFTSVLCFLTFNVLALIGSLTAAAVQWPKPKYLWIVMVFRFLLIPYFLMCNYQPFGKKRKAKVWIKSDTAYWIGGIINGFLTAHCTSLSMQYTSRCVESKYAPVAGMMASAFLITGIAAGICVSFIWPHVVT